MKEVSLHEIHKNVDFSKLFVGIITNVDTTNMILGVDIVDIPGEINASIPFSYVSSVSRSFSVFVPKIGDRVIIAMKQANEWEVVGYRPSLVAPNESGWGSMHVGDYPAKPPALSSGDYGVCVHEEDKAVEFLMLANGTLLLSAGLVYFVMNQVANSLMQVMGYCSWMSGKLEMEWGDARAVVGNEQKVIAGESLWRIRESEKKEEIAMGFINDNGIPEKSRLGKNIRFKTKIGNAEIKIDESGAIEIDAVDNVELSIKDGGVIKLSKSQCNIDISEINIKGNIDVVGNITNDGDIDISGQVQATQGNIGGNIGLVLESLLPLITSHVHPAPGGTTAPSLQLSNIGGFVTKNLRGG